MVYNNFEIHNVAELTECEGGGTSWLRLPKNAYEVMSETGQRLVRGSTGVELRFVMLDDEVTLKIQSLSTPSSVTTFQIFYGGIQGGWECHEVNKYISTDLCEFVIKKPSNLETLKRMNEQAGYDWNPEVIRIIFNRGTYRVVGIEGAVRPPRADEVPQKTLLCYGSSITHGSNAYTQPDSWPSVVAHNLNYDLVNLGMAGSCRMEKEIVDYIAAEKWDMAVLELGINVLGWEEEKARSHVAYTLEKIAGENPDRPVYVISPFYCHDDFNNDGVRANMWRRVIEQECARLAYSNVTYINGLYLLGDMSLISADEVHPNIYGVRQIAQKLTEVIK